VKPLVHLSVTGSPAPKGSSQSFAARRKTGEYTGKIGYRPDASGYPAWHEAVRHDGAEYMGRHNLAPLSGALSCGMTIRFDRPRSHYRTGQYSQQLRPDAPVWPIEGRAAKDIDKLVRAIFDGLQDGGVIENDCQIPLLGPVMRVYCTAGETPGADIWLYRAPIKPPHFELLSAGPEGPQ
jgi:Endodeoxyribonuclease RusA